MENVDRSKMRVEPARKDQPVSGLARFFKENSLSLVMFGFFFLFLIGVSVTGWLEYNSDQQDHRQAQAGYIEYLATGHFWEAIFENWESEFLQVGSFIILSVWFKQKGSAETKKLDQEEAVDEDPRNHRHDKNAPWPVRKGGLVLTLYENSLGLAFTGLFVVTFVLHVFAGSAEYCQDQLAHNAQCVSPLEFATTSRFWFQSFQNWQSEFLVIALLLFLSIFLRQRGSSQSKPVHAPHSETGRD